MTKNELEAEAKALRVKLEGMELAFADAAGEIDQKAARILELEEELGQLRRELQRAINGDSRLRDLLEHPPTELDEGLLRWIRTAHEAEPLRRHIDLSHRQRRLDHLEHLNADLQRRNEAAIELGTRLAHEKEQLRQVLADANARVAASIELGTRLAHEKEQLRARLQALTPSDAPDLPATNVVP